MPGQKKPSKGQILDLIPDPPIQPTCRRPISLSHLQKILPSTIRPEINSNDFGRFWELFSRFEFDFRRCGNSFQLKKFDFWCVWSLFTHTECGFTFTCAVSCFHTCVDEMQTHSGKQREKLTERQHPHYTHRRTSQTDSHQTTHTTQTHHTSIPTVVVFLMVHDNMYVYTSVFVHVHANVFCTCIWIYE